MKNILFWTMVTLFATQAIFITWFGFFHEWEEKTTDTWALITAALIMLVWVLVDKKILK